MSQPHHEVNYKTYWLTWFVLLILTFGMIPISGSTLPRGVFVLLLLLAMLAKATFILGTFMHLRFEKAALILMVVLGISLTAAALFAGIAPDGIRALSLGLR